MCREIIGVFNNFFPFTPTCNKPHLVLFRFYENMERSWNRRKKPHLLPCSDWAVPRPGAAGGNPLLPIAGAHGAQEVIVECVGEDLQHPADQPSVLAVGRRVGPQAEDRRTEG